MTQSDTSTLSQSTQRFTGAAVITVLVPLASLALVLLGYGFALSVESQFGIAHSLFIESVLDYLHLSVHVIAFFPEGLTWSVFLQQVSKLYGKLWPFGLGLFLLVLAMCLGNLLVHIAQKNAWPERLIGGVKAAAGAVQCRCPLCYRLGRVFIQLCQSKVVRFATASMALIAGFPIIAVGAAFALLSLVVVMYCLLPLIGYVAGHAHLQRWVVAPEICASVASRTQRMEAVTRHNTSSEKPQSDKMPDAASCVRVLRKDAPEGAEQGRVVVATSQWLVLFDPHSGAVWRVPVKEARVDVVATLIPAKPPSAPSVEGK